MYIKVPAEIGFNGLADNIYHIGTTHGDMVLEAVLADILHQFLQVIDLCHGDTAVHAIWVVGDVPLA